MITSEKILYWASLRVLGLLSIEEFPLIADELIQNGYESPELLMLSLPSEANHETFVAAFGEIGTAMPEKKDAERIVICHLVENMLIATEPLECLHGIKEVRDVICEVKDGCHVCSIPEFSKLADYYWAYEETIGDVDDGSYKAELEEAVRNIASEIRNACLTNQSKGAK